MPALFNADEVFAIAVQIENNGAAFYRKAARGQKDEGNVAYLEELARMEDDHARIFTEMRQGASAGSAGGGSDLYNEGALYLSAIADGYRVEGSPKVADSLTGEETMEDIVRTAIGLEKDSIVFYLGLRDVVPETLGRDKIDLIIAEEKKHIVTLSEHLKKVRAAE
jgi:rubrerythrin